MVKKILITGGPVHAYLDDVKIITNKFKGGLMAQLANDLSKVEGIEIHYLTSKNSTLPVNKDRITNPKIIYHNGIEDYMEKVVTLSPQMDAVVLGAAVANLIPKNKIKGKFPSHNYKPGDTIPIEFTIAPRIIDEVKKVNPKTLLFGYKLLSGINYNELITASYGVLLESKAVTIFANDAKDLMQKYAVTKERGVHPLLNIDVAQWILDRINEQYYQTIFEPIEYIPDSQKDEFMELVKKYKFLFTHTPEGYVFGCVAKRIILSENPSQVSFFTTIRGKNEIKNYTIVKNVEHKNRFVVVPIGHHKASLNAPLLHRIFETRRDVDTIVHYHGDRDDLLTQKYATPGTDKDSLRTGFEVINPSFNIEGHGCILSFDKKGNLLKGIRSI